MTTLPLDVPFTPDDDYPDFLAERAHALDSVHFSLYDPALADARQLLAPRDPAALLDGLARLGDVRRYALMNARLHRPGKYFDRNALQQTADILSTFADKDFLDGIVFADPYYLQALSDHAPDLAARIEAVPSVNLGVDSPGRAFAALDLVAGTRFRPPSRLILDRDLNRERARLAATTAAIKAELPDIQLLLMANEGCLFNCPYKSAHNAHIAMVNEGLCGERTYAMNRDLGCIRRLLDDPSLTLASPFIRPEDAHRYADHVHALKLCGRNQGVPFLKRAVDAYIQGRYTGNLLDLMDAMGDLNDRIHIDNQQLPDTFLDHAWNCTKHCANCTRCPQLATAAITTMQPDIPRFENG